MICSNCVKLNKYVLISNGTALTEQQINSILACCCNDCIMPKGKTHYRLSLDGKKLLLHGCYENNPSVDDIGFVPQSFEVLILNEMHSELRTNISDWDEETGG